jgi:hypothetical protein
MSHIDAAIPGVLTPLGRRPRICEILGAIRLPERSQNQFQEVKISSQLRDLHEMLISIFLIIQ